MKHGAMVLGQVQPANMLTFTRYQVPGCVREHKCARVGLRLHAGGLTCSRMEGAIIVPERHTNQPSSVL